MIYGLVIVRDKSSYSLLVEGERGFTEAYIFQEFFKWLGKLFKMGKIFQGKMVKTRKKFKKREEKQKKGEGKSK